MDYTDLPEVKYSIFSLQAISCSNDNYPFPYWLETGYVDIHVLCCHRCMSFFVLLLHVIVVIFVYRRQYRKYVEVYRLLWECRQQQLQQLHRLRLPQVSNILCHAAAEAVLSFLLVQKWLLIGLGLVNAYGVLQFCSTQLLLIMLLQNNSLGKLMWNYFEITKHNEEQLDWPEL